MTHLQVPSGAMDRSRWLPRIRVSWQAPGVGWWLWGAAGTVVVVAGAAMAMWGMFPVNLHGPGHFAGIMAPTCGLTRSVVATFRGDVGMAWRYNPLGPLIAFTSVAILASLVTGAVLGRRPVLRVRLGRLGWIVLILALVALEIRQQGQAELLMTTGLH
ncbi:DUF2752 domain-containing protein [Streptomyces sp. NPDC044948]|uniref:DUF2752 domain-containing protein n=1 Tax=Streptomyces sp. NPDC044948 TaxID=3157092 RepID=UPI0033CB1A7A